MIKRILPLLITLFFFSNSNAQLKPRAKALYNSGLVLKANQKLPEALQAFAESIKLYNKFDSAFVELGALQLTFSQTDEAINSYKAALALSPRMTIALTALGKVYRDYKHIYDSSIYYYKKAAITDPADKETFYSIAWNYNAQKEHDSAIVYGIKALEIDNDYKPGYSELAHAYRRVGKFADAVAQFKKNLAISTVDLALLYSGYCYTELKNKEAATEMYESLNKINEKMASALKKVIDKME